MSVVTAAKAAMRAFVSRQANAETDPGSVRWSDAIVAVVLLAALILTTELLPIALSAPQLIDQLIGPFAISLVVRAVPFLVIVVCAVASRQRARLPMVVMMTAIGLILIQVTSFLLSFVGFRADTALVGVIAYLTGRASRTMLNFSIAGAIVVGLIVAVGSVAASFLFFLLPGAESMFGP